MKIEIEITPKRITDLVITACECNDMTASWCAGFKPVDTDAMEAKYPDLTRPWYSDERLWADADFKVNVSEVTDETAELDEPGNVVVHLVGAAEIAAGFKLMAEKHGRHFGDFMAENEDSITADVFLQCVALKDVVYG